MPKGTFLNLPELKRQLIEEAALDEFATWGFDNASINRIVADCQIAKGSFYQYFEDKKDLYKHLLSCIAHKKIEYISPVLQNPMAHDFFTVLQEMYRSGLAFAQENPKAALIGNQVFKNREHPIHREVFDESKETAVAFYQNLIALAIERGELRTDIDVRFMIHILMSLNVATFEYYFEVVKGADFNITKIDEDIMETVNLFIDFIRRGISDPIGEKI
ncbi:TetR/AcrR family transcriptional regulator [Candidatus Leptofilum sp.]|uniref:TetR/AcrR family transcriptional regulator n=1 Tax=Candidatus Leptofilum sp. TaxID=3241576 RepID=UPI003B58C6C7